MDKRLLWLIGEEDAAHPRNGQLLFGDANGLLEIRCAQTPTVIESHLSWLERCASKLDTHGMVWIGILVSKHEGPHQAGSDTVACGDLWSKTPPTCTFARS